MQFAYHHMRRQARQRLERDFVAQPQVVTERDVDLQGMQLVDQQLLIAFDHVQVDFVEGAREPEDHLGRDHGRERLEAAHAQGALDGIAGDGRDLVEARRALEQVFAFAHDLLAEHRQGQALGRMPDEQLHVQLGFDMCDGGRNRRRRNVDLAGCRGDTAVLGRGDEVLHLAQRNAIEHNPK
ncbi:hypothetical protein D3C72_1647440 [compost metagenome]